MKNDKRSSGNESNDYPPYYHETFKVLEADSITRIVFNKATKNVSELGSILYEFDILKNKKLSKEKGYIVTTESGERSIVVTDCGGFHISCKKVLEEKVAEYRQLIQETEKALYLFENIQ